MENMEWMHRLDNADKYAIYGAGVVAQNAYVLLSALLEKEFAGFWVSEKKENDVKLKMTEQMYHQPIYDLQQKKIDKETFVIIAVSERYRKEIEERLLSEVNEINYVFLSYEVRNYLFESYYREYLTRKDIDLSADIISIGNQNGRTVKIKNPFLEEKRNRNSCFSELGTIIMPACYSDIKLASETPYEYEGVTLDAFEKGVVFDLGANQGYFAVLAASLGHTVYAFEPSKNLQGNLLEYSKIYDERINVEEAAVGDYDGEGELYVDAFSDDANSMVLKTNAEETEKIKVVTLDEYVKNKNIQRIDFIKADIEGAERNMLWGAKKVLKEFSPMLSICTYHLPDDPEVIQKAILDANPNYKIIQKEKKLYAWV